MADSCRERIVAAARAVLEAISPQIPVERNRRAALDLETESFPRLILFEGDEMPGEPYFTFEDPWHLPLIVQGVVRKAEGDSDDADIAARANALRAQVQRAILADISLGGLVRDLRPADAGDFLGLDGESESGSTQGFLMSFTVSYATAEGDPFTFA